MKVENVKGWSEILWPLFFHTAGGSCWISNPRHCPADWADNEPRLLRCEADYVMESGVFS